MPAPFLKYIEATSVGKRWKKPLACAFYNILWSSGRRQELFAHFRQIAIAIYHVMRYNL